MICGTREYKQTNRESSEWNLMNYDVVRYFNRFGLSSFSDCFGCLLFDLDFSKLLVLSISSIRKAKRTAKSGITKSKHFCVSHHWSNNNKILKNNTKRKVTFLNLTRPREGCEPDGICPRKRRTTGVLFICVFSVLTTFRHTDSDTLTHSHTHTHTRTHKHSRASEMPRAKIGNRKT